ncbi:hypothetical protein JTB14_029779 [Gonioctena quinquepunctata]|nr:hypothetical protein JTB14_029779 [Gonioctena quinquepunctata]
MGVLPPLNPNATLDNEESLMISILSISQNQSEKSIKNKMKFMKTKNSKRNWKKLRNTMKQVDQKIHKTGKTEEPIPPTTNKEKVTKPHLNPEVLINRQSDAQNDAKNQGKKETQSQEKRKPNAE